MAIMVMSVPELANLLCFKELAVHLYEKGGSKCRAQYKEYYSALPRWSAVTTFKSQYWWRTELNLPYHAGGPSGSHAPPRH